MTLVMKKRFGLVALTSLGGLVAATGGGACGGAVANGGDDGGVSASSSGAPGGSSSASGGGGSIGSSASSGSTGSSGTGGSAAAGSGGASPDAGYAGACTGTLPISPAALLWRSPFLAAGSCTQAELDALVLYVDGNPAASYVDWKASVTDPTCASCIFGLVSATTWKPLLANATGTLVEQNVGGCIAIASGNDSCGRAYQNWFDCRFQACSDCASGDSVALAKCQIASTKTGGSCKTYFDAVVPACTDKGISDAETACTGAKFVFEGSIRAQCIGIP
jgi:hypothetical protein